VIVEDHDHDVVSREAVAQLQQAGHGGARGVAGEDPLLPCDPARHDRRVLVGHFLEAFDEAEVHILGQEVLADAFSDVGIDLVLVEDSGFLVFLEHGPVRVDAPQLDRRVLFLEKPAGPEMVPPVPTPTTRCVTRPSV
jgi:hypothetical protein